MSCSNFAPNREDGPAPNPNIPGQQTNNQALQATISHLGNILDGSGCVAHAARADTNIPQVAGAGSDVLDRDRPLVERLHQASAIQSGSSYSQPSRTTAPGISGPTDPSTISNSSRYDWDGVKSYIAENFRLMKYADLVIRLQEEHDFTVTEQVLKKQLTHWGLKKNITEPDRLRYQRSDEYRECLDPEQHVRYGKHISRHNARERRKPNNTALEGSGEASRDVLVAVGTRVEANDELATREQASGYQYDTEMRLHSENEDSSLSMDAERTLAAMQSQVTNTPNVTQQPQVATLSHENGFGSAREDPRHESPPEMGSPNLNGGYHPIGVGPSFGNQFDTQSDDAFNPDLDPALFQDLSPMVQPFYFEEVPWGVFDFSYGGAMDD